MSMASAVVRLLARNGKNALNQPNVVSRAVAKAGEYNLVTASAIALAKSNGSAWNNALFQATRSISVSSLKPSDR